MKTLFLFLALPFAFLFAPENINYDSSESTMVKKIKVEVEIEFGRAKKNCRGFGICGIDISAGKKGVMKGFASRGTLVVENSQVIGIIFHRKSMNKKTAKKFFDSKAFVAEESFSKKFSYKGDSFIMNLKAGEYELEKTETGFNIGMPPS